MDLETMRMFVNVARTRSITKAADEGLISKSAVKKQMDALEADVGTILMQRSTRGIELTPAGEVFLTGIKRLLGEYDELKSACRLVESQTASRSVRVAYYSDILFPCIQYCCDHYLDVYPDDVCIPVPTTFNEAYSGIRDGLFDVAFCPRPRPEESAGLASVTTFRTPMCGLVSPSSPLAKKDSLSRRDLAEHTVGIPRIWYTQEGLREWSRLSGEPFEIVPQPTGLDGMQNVCGSGGIYLFPRSDAEVYPFYIGLPLEDPLMMTGSLTFSTEATGAVLDYVRETERFMRQRTDPQTLELLVDWSKRPA